MANNWYPYTNISLNPGTFIWASKQSVPLPLGTNGKKLICENLRVNYAGYLKDLINQFNEEAIISEKSMIYLEETLSILIAQIIMQYFSMYKDHFFAADEKTKFCKLIVQKLIKKYKK